MAREIALLTNPTAGRRRGSTAAAAVLPRLRAAGFAVRNLVSQSAADADELARRCVADGLECVVAVGGDGMVHTVIQALAGTSTRLGLVPAGSGNDVARALGIPRSDPAAAADLIVAGRSRRIDLGRVSGRYFATVLAAGFDAVVNERANSSAQAGGQLRYTLAAAAELRAFRPIPYVVEADGVTSRFEAMTVAVGNGPSFGGGLRISHGARLDDGLLDLVTMMTMTRTDLLRTYPRLFRGSHTSHPAYRRQRVRRVTIAAPGITAYADGERIGPLPLTVQVVPGALEVIAP